MTPSVEHSPSRLDLAESQVHGPSAHGVSGVMLGTAVTLFL